MLLNELAKRSTTIPTTPNAILFLKTKNKTKPLGFPALRCISNTVVAMLLGLLRDLRCQELKINFCNKTNK